MLNDCQRRGKKQRIRTRRSSWELIVAFLKVPTWKSRLEDFSSRHVCQLLLEPDSIPTPHLIMYVAKKRPRPINAKHFGVFFSLHRLQQLHCSFETFFVSVMLIRWAILHNTFCVIFYTVLLASHLWSVFLKSLQNVQKVVKLLD